ncbi:hypothetical protein Q8F55_002755 [Vanrija albida]|uniref:BTB domain-containing protein n=1 Tax=Vanrija albida TaxID=181172 RepID=A0ABR3QAN0_9TREE
MPDSTDSIDSDGVNPRKRARTESVSITDDNDWATGDFAIVSSDNIRFRIDRHHLQSASSVFADMLSVLSGGSQEIHLTDETIEQSGTIKRFIPLLLSATLDLTSFKHDLCAILRLVRFLIKYDCQVSINIVKLHLRADTMTETNSSRIWHFIVSSVLDDVELEDKDKLHIEFKDFIEAARKSIANEPKSFIDSA